MSKKARSVLLPVLLVLTLLVPLVAAPFVAPVDAQKSGPSKESPRENIMNLMEPVQDVISGPGWLMAKGIDSRLWIKRPGWNTLTRHAWEETAPFTAGNSAPAQQGGVLVPFRSPAPAFSRSLLVTRDYSDSPMQTEPHLAVNPNDPNHLLLGVIDYNFPNVSSYVSVDGGVTWEGPTQIKYLRGDLVAGGDPLVIFDQNEQAYLASLSLGTEEYEIGPVVGDAMVSSIQIAVSPDGGFTWEEPVSTARSKVETRNLTFDTEGRVRGNVYVGFVDKPWIAVGPNPDDPEEETIYLVYTDFITRYDILYIGEVPTLGAPELETTIRLVRSEDGGVTWSEPIGVSPTVREVFGQIGEEPSLGPVVGTKRIVQGAQVGVDADGTVYVAWVDSTDDGSQDGLAELYVARSYDGGETFGDPKRVTTFLEPGFRPRNAFFRYWASAFPQLSVGPDGSVNILYTGLPAERPTDDGDVFFVRSEDGERWSPPVRLNQDDTDHLQFFPSIDVGPDGVIHAMWGDMRDDPVQTSYHIYYTRSEDGGKTWGFTVPELDLALGDTRVTDFASNTNKGFPSGLFLGDYFSIAATEEDVYLVWADTRLGEFGPVNQKIGFARRRQIPAPELYMSPPAGAGGQNVTIQGHNFQPNMDVFLQVADNVVASARTDDQGRVSAEVFMPISGEGGHQVRLLDESGNVAASSFFMEFGFNSMRPLLEGQTETQQQLASLDQRLENQPEAQPAALDEETVRSMQQDLERLRNVETEVQELRRLMEQSQQPAAEPVTSGPPPAWSWGLVGMLGLAVGAVVVYAWSGRRRRE